MQRFLLAGLIAFPGVALHAQTAPDIARDTAAETVIRLYGWPRGKSTTEGRESWMYDHFQVLFENGRVVSVSPLLQGKNQPKRPVTPSAANQPAAKPLTRAASPIAPAPAVRPTGVGQMPREATPPLPSPYVRDTGTSRPPSPKRQPTPTLTASFWLKILWPLGLLLAAGTVVQLVAAVIKRKKRGTEQGHTPRSTGTTNRPKTWEDAVAERLAQKHGGLGAQTAQAKNAGAGPDLTPALLRRLEWKRFEQVVALYFEATGVRAECTCIGPDGGVDVKLFRPGYPQPFSYVQCKAWGAEKVPVTKLREFLGVMAADKITEGIFITTSDFWPDARAFAEANGIAALTTTDFVDKFQTLPPETRTRILATVTRGDYTTPTCPQCDSKMVWKPRASFWACPRFPQCRSKPIWPRTV